MTGGDFHLNTVAKIMVVKIMVTKIMVSKIIQRSN
jgi:hypothetical protein